MRLQNVHSNRHASSKDIAMEFSHIEHLRHILHGGSLRYDTQSGILVLTSLHCSGRVGAGLVQLGKSAEVQCFITSRSPKTVKHDKLIYQPGVLRKVN